MYSERCSQVMDEEQTGSTDILSADIRVVPRYLT